MMHAGRKIRSIPYSNKPDTTLILNIKTVCQLILNTNGHCIFVYSGYSGHKIDFSPDEPQNVENYGKTQWLILMVFFMPWLIYASPNRENNQ